jgi:hypothetical protein
VNCNNIGDLVWSDCVFVFSGNVRYIGAGRIAFGVALSSFRLLYPSNSLFKNQLKIF